MSYATRKPTQSYGSKKTATPAPSKGGVDTTHVLKTSISKEELEGGAQSEFVAGSFLYENQTKDGRTFLKVIVKEGLPAGSYVVFPRNK